MQSLFRPEAVAHATRRLDGAVLLPAPLTAWVAIAMVVTVLAFVAWFATARSYTRQESVPGWISAQTVQRGDSIAVVAADGELVAELFVPQRAAELVAVGQTLRLKYEALPYGRHAQQQGTVIHVSPTALAPEETSHAGIPVKGPVFRVRVRLPTQRVDAEGIPVDLRPGMLLTAEIAGHRRRLFETLFEPDAVTP